MRTCDNFSVVASSWLAKTSDAVHSLARIDRIGRMIEPRTQPAGAPSCGTGVCALD